MKGENLPPSLQVRPLALVLPKRSHYLFLDVMETGLDAG